MNKQNQAFTLVELIVVVTILAILSTIGFVSYSSYLTGVRDTNRISNMKALSDGLELFRTKNTLPLPDNYVEVVSYGDIVAYQGYAGANIVETIEFSNLGVDPKEGTYYSYYLTKDRKAYQLMGFLEEQENLQTVGIFNQTTAVDYSIKHPTVYGKKLGILTDEFNTPIQEVTSIVSAGKIELDTTNSGTTYLAHIDDNSKLENTGLLLAGLIKTLVRTQAKFGAPTYCPTGFIPVPGDTSLGQPGFCAAKYEMSWHGLTGSDGFLNSYSYNDNGDKGTIVSEVGNSPIAEITQLQAITECNAMGKGYHLIMNSEWMAIARNIEKQGKNWSSGTAGDGYIYNGISGTTYGCDGTNASALPVANNYGTLTGHDICGGKNKLVLSNGEEIWDLAGNMWEHVNKINTTSGLNYNAGQTILGTGTNIEWNNLEIDSNELKNYGPLIAKNESNGIGNVFNLDGILNNIFLRSNDAYFPSNGGIFSLGLAGNDITSINGIGFRCAYIK